MRFNTKLSRSRISVGVFVMIAQNSDVIRKLSSYGARPIFFAAFVLTARQYGEVVLPDASIRAESRYPAAGGATKLSRCKEGMAHFLPSVYKFY